MSAQWPFPAIRRLPHVVKPIQDETLTSYLHRLARANHWPFIEIARYLSPRTWPYRDANARASVLHGARPAPIELSALVLATGVSIETLVRTLPEIRDQHPDALAMTRGRNVAGYPNDEHPACRRCVATKGVTTQATVWRRHDQNVCLRHQLWIGYGSYSPQYQVDLQAVPEIVAAQRQHSELINRLGRRWVSVVTRRAFEFANHWLRHSSHTPAYQRFGQLSGQLRKGTNLPPRGAIWYAATYPDVVTLTGILASPLWRRPPPLDDKRTLRKLELQIRHEALPTYVIGQRTDPILRWFELLRAEPDLFWWDFRELQQDLNAEEIVGQSTRFKAESMRRSAQSSADRADPVRHPDAAVSTHLPNPLFRASTPSQNQ
ncbi:TniQ family protein [Streptosporangium sp. NPDC051023]|uniref:TniQ family protein n=1 Tax=Streptosporangium sp. NPDC051023 TaxID=3155410 RepID=UPI00344BD573